FLSPYPYGVVNRSEITSPSEMVKLIAGTRSERALLRFEETSNASVTGSLPLESAYPTPDSVVLQPRSTVTYNGLAVELFVDGRTRLLIPIESRGIMRHEVERLESKAARDALVSRFGDDDEHEMAILRFVDLGRLWMAIASLVT